MRNILTKIYFHPLFIITTFIFILIGKFRFILYFMMLILIHELGHILVSLYYKWNIEKVILLPFGGLTKYKIFINHPVKEEFFVSIAGITFQIIFYIFINKIVHYKYFSVMNYFIIIFNLIPIYPLDGSKIMSFIINKITSYKNSLKICSIVSYLSLIFILILSFNINKLFILVLIFLLIETIKLSKNINYIFNRFLLERYLNNFKFKKIKVIKRIDEMKLDYTHIFNINNKFITEKEILHKMFDKGNDL